MKLAISLKHIVLIIAVLVLVPALAPEPVLAATCTWNPAVSSDWGNAGNWTNCGGGVPTGTDTAVIPATATDPVVSVTRDVGTLDIHSGATVTLNSGVTLTAGNLELHGTLTGDGNLLVALTANWYAGGVMSGSGETEIIGSGTLDVGGNVDLISRTVRNEGVASWYGSSTIWASAGATFVNNGTLNAQSDTMVLTWHDELNATGFTNNGTFNASGANGVMMNTALQNDGTINITSTVLRLRYGSSSSGSFQGGSGAYLILGSTSSPGQNFDFVANSVVDVGDLQLDSPGAVNVNGYFNVNGTGTTRVNGDPGGSSALNFNSSATLAGLGGELRFGYATVSLDSGESVSVPKINQSGGILTGSDNLAVTNLYTWYSGTLSGTGALTIANGATLGLPQNGTRYLNGRFLTNNGTIAWYADGDIVGSNGAALDNYGTFAATGNADFTGGGDVTVTNYGTLVKSAGTMTTTIGVDFQNYGTISEQSGHLVFTYGNLTLPAGSSLNLAGGVLNPGSTLVIAGGLLGGDGSVAGNVWNAGIVSPGQSPGHIEVQGQYTQTVTGTLALEIAGYYDFDRITVRETADLAGTLVVTLTGSFQPAVGSAFRVMTYTARAGAFDSLNLAPLAGGRQWSVDYAPDGVYLRVPQDPITGLVALNDGPTPLLAPTTLTATVSGGDNISYTWNFGDGSGGGGAVAVHTYMNPGRYTAVVTAANSINSAVASTTVWVDEPIAGLVALSSGNPGLGKPVTLTATLSAGSNVSYTWDFGDDWSATGAVVTHTYAFPGVYTATVTAVNSVGMETAAVVIVVTEDSPQSYLYLPVVIRP